MGAYLSIRIHLIPLLIKIKNYKVMVVMSLFDFVKVFYAKVPYLEALTGMRLQIIRLDFRFSCEQLLLLLFAVGNGR